ncbi:MAG: PIN domain-containing protein [Anaerolineae bacterium]
MPIYVLDTSALLTVLNDEEGADQVLDLLAVAGDEERQPEATTVYLPFVALMELEYLTRRTVSEAQTQQVIMMVKAWPVQLRESTEEWRHEAAEVKATTSLSVADAWICGLARLLDAQLVHKDPEYDAVDGLKSFRLSRRKSS